MADGITTQQHKEGNHIADLNADAGTALHGENKIATAKAYNGKPKRYTKFVKTG